MSCCGATALSLTGAPVTTPAQALPCSPHLTSPQTHHHTHYIAHRRLARSQSAPEVLFFDLDAAVTSQQLSYEEQLFAFVLQGLANGAEDAAPTLQ
jgi:hypothetical protein